MSYLEELINAAEAAKSVEEAKSIAFTAIHKLSKLQEAYDKLVSKHLSNTDVIESYKSPEYRKLLREENEMLLDRVEMELLGQ